MERYVCPKCNSGLDVNGQIVFLVKNANKETGIVLLSAEVGDYSAFCNPSFLIEDGEHNSFCCPICQKTLEAPEINSNLAKIKYIDNDNKEHYIVFSSIKGEKCTFKITDEKVLPFGENPEKYLDFFNISVLK